LLPKAPFFIAQVCQCGQGNNAYPAQRPSGAVIVKDFPVMKDFPRCSVGNFT
jgi:hypothetical protein